MLISFNIFTFDIFSAAVCFNIGQKKRDGRKGKLGTKQRIETEALEKEKDVREQETHQGRMQRKDNRRKDSKCHYDRHPLEKNVPTRFHPFHFPTKQWKRERKTDEEASRKARSRNRMGIFQPGRLLPAHVSGSDWIYTIGFFGCLIKFEMECERNKCIYESKISFYNMNEFKTNI